MNLYQPFLSFSIYIHSLVYTIIVLLLSKYFFVKTKNHLIHKFTSMLILKNFGIYMYEYKIDGL